MKNYIASGVLALATVVGAAYLLREPEWKEIQEVRRVFAPLEAEVQQQGGGVVAIKTDSLIREEPVKINHPIKPRRGDPVYIESTTENKEPVKPRSHSISLEEFLQRPYFTDGESFERTLPDQFRDLSELCKSWRNLENNQYVRTVIDHDDGTRRVHHQIGELEVYEYYATKIPEISSQHTIEINSLKDGRKITYSIPTDETNGEFDISCFYRHIKRTDGGGVEDSIKLAHPSSRMSREAVDNLRKITGGFLKYLKDVQATIK